MAGMIPFGCGQCLPCRVNRRRLWAWRMWLESLCHDENCFVTLTYSAEHYPSDGSLRPLDVTNFLKRFRKSIEPLKVRYFLVGEYGEQTERAHYHLSMFGVGQAHMLKIQEAWPFGFTSTHEFNEKTAAYVAGYVTKKMTRKDDPRLNGRYPEFARMSLRPGIGAPAMKVIGDQLHTPAGLDELAKGDVPMRLKLGRIAVPLGRYLRKVLRDEVGMPEHMVQAVKDKFAQEKSLEMCALFETTVKIGKYISIKEAEVARNLGRIRSIEGKSKLTKKGTL